MIASLLALCLLALFGNAEEAKRNVTRESHRFPSFDDSPSSSVRWMAVGDDSVSGVLRELSWRRLKRLLTLGMPLNYSRAGFLCDFKRWQNERQQQLLEQSINLSTNHTRTDPYPISSSSLPPPWDLQFVGPSAGLCLRVVTDEEVLRNSSSSSSGQDALIGSRGGEGWRQARAQGEFLFDPFTAEPNAGKAVIHSPTEAQGLLQSLQNQTTSEVPISSGGPLLQGQGKESNEEWRAVLWDKGMDYLKASSSAFAVTVCCHGGDPQATTTSLLQPVKPVVEGRGGKPGWCRPSTDGRRNREGMEQARVDRGSEGRLVHWVRQYRPDVLSLNVGRNDILVDDTAPMEVMKGIAKLIVRAVDAFVGIHVEGSGSALRGRAFNSSRTLSSSWILVGTLLPLLATPSRHGSVAACGRTPIRAVKIGGKSKTPIPTWAPPLGATEKGKSSDETTPAEPSIPAAEELIRPTRVDHDVLKAEMELKENRYAFATCTEKVRHTNTLFLSHLCPLVQAALEVREKELRERSERTGARLRRYSLRPMRVTQGSAISKGLRLGFVSMPYSTLELRNELQFVDGVRVSTTTERRIARRWFKAWVELQTLDAALEEEAVSNHTYPRGSYLRECRLPETLLHLSDGKEAPSDGITGVHTLRSDRFTGYDVTLSGRVVSLGCLLLVLALTGKLWMRRRRMRSRNV
jgi:hypothetical protein